MSIVLAQLSQADGVYTLDIRCPDYQYGDVGDGQADGDYHDYDGAYDEEGFGFAS